jgi:hypothetical protein
MDFTPVEVVTLLAAAVLCWLQLRVLAGISRLQQSLGEQSTLISRRVTSALTGLMETRQTTRQGCGDKGCQPRGGVFGPPTEELRQQREEDIRQAQQRRMRVRLPDDGEDVVAVAHTPDDLPDYPRGFPFPVMLVALLVWGAGAGEAQAQFADPVDLEFTVAGPTQVQVGRRIHFSLKFSKAEKPDVVLRYRVLRQSNSDAVFDFGEDCTAESIYGWGDPGVYEFEFEAILQSNAKVSHKKTYRVEIFPHKSVDPLPLPKPKPLKPDEDDAEPKPVDPLPKPVDPTPPTPPVNPRPGPGEFDLAPRLYDLSVASTSPTRVADALKLAAEARRIATGGGSLNAMAAEIVAALNALPAGWEPLKSHVKETVTRLATGGKLKTSGDMARLLVECAAALEAAAKVVR